MTTLLTTYFLDDAEALCKRVTLIDNGRLVANDTLENQKPSHGKRHLMVTISDPKNDNRYLHDFLKIDDPNDQSQLYQLMVERNIHSVNRSGDATSMSLCINRDTINAQTQVLKTAINNYVRAITIPKPPVKVDTTEINPHSTLQAGINLEHFYSRSPCYPHII